MEYTIVTADDCHRLIIPFNKKKEFEEWLENEDERDEWPEYAQYIDGATIVFKEWREV